LHNKNSHFTTNLPDGKFGLYCYKKKKKTVEYEISLLYLAGIEISSRYRKDSKKIKTD
jgi:hypothetical protein